MRITTALALSTAALLAAAPAHALTFTNADKKEHTIGLDMGDKESVHKIPAGQSVTFKSECNDGCGVTGPWNYSVMLKTGDTWKIDGSSPVSVPQS